MCEVTDILLTILIPACVSFSPAFCMMYTAYKLNKQDDNIQPWHTLFPIWNQSVVPCLVLAAASWPAYKFFRRKERCSCIPISWRIFCSCDPHKGFGVVNKAEVNVFLELSYFFYEPTYVLVWSLIPLPFLNQGWRSGSSWFTYCWSVSWRTLSITWLSCEISAIVQ